LKNREEVVEKLLPASNKYEIGGYLRTLDYVFVSRNGMFRAGVKTAPRGSCLRRVYSAYFYGD
jgi:hypothetical protein